MNFKYILAPFYFLQLLIIMINKLTQCFWQTIILIKQMNLKLLILSISFTTKHVIQHNNLST